MTSLETLVTDEPQGASRPTLRLIEPTTEPEAELHFSKLDGGYNRIVKPTVDRLGSLVLVIVLLPVLVAVAACIRFKLGPGVVYRQERVGRGGKVFTVLKFRTMDPDRRSDQVPFSGTDRRHTHKTDDDPRHSAFGRWLRKSSLDELPQLLNVLSGQMSLVGPRPELATVVEQYDLWEHPRHQVRPGITGLWQVSPLRTELLHENMHIDVEYLDQVSLATDVRLMLSTVGAVSSKTGH